MKQACRKLVVYAFVGAILSPASLVAQKEEKDVKEKKEAEQIIITRKGDKSEKVVVEIVGDKITVNGKPIEDLKDGDVTVRRNKIKDVWAFADGLKAGGTFYNPAEQFRMLSVDSNTAMLGVTTDKTEQGVEIQEITKESGAAKAGLQKGDIITKINDQKIESPDQLSAAIKKQKPGDKVTVTYLRDKKESKTTAELSKWKGARMFKTVPGQAFDFDMGDLDLDNIMPRIQHTVPKVRAPYGQGWSGGAGPKLGLSVQDTDNGKGVKVLEVDEESNAAKAGLKEEDVITEIDGKAVNNVDEVTKIIRESKDKPSVMLKLQRGNKTQNVEVKIPRKIKTADL